MSQVFSLVDCNNFYASCERVFDPRLAGRPVVVLSNNDGCVVARSAEAKAMKIPMGIPYFQIQKDFEKAGGVAKSSNYALYGDMSARVMSILATFSPEAEIYSIDECFLGMAGVEDRTAVGMAIREQVRDWTGLPVCVGVGPSKTLAKLANHVAKKRPEWGGVCDLAALGAADRDAVIGGIEVGEVWGVGNRIAERLARMNVLTVRQLRDADPDLIRQEFSVVLERTVRELRGVSCIPLEEAPPPKQQIMSSKSFGQPILVLQDLEEAVAAYVTRAAEKLRRQHSVAGSVLVLLRTNPFRPEDPQYHPSVTMPLVVPSGDTRTLLEACLAGLARIYRPGYTYKKAGIMLMDLSPAGRQQNDLFAPSSDSPRSQALMATLDAINQRFGRGTLHTALEGGRQLWRMKRDRMSPCYTTRWGEIPIAQALD